MQADTVFSKPNADAGAPVAPVPHAHVRLSNALKLDGTYTATFWRLVPILFGLAAWLPQIWQSVTAFAKSSVIAGGAAASGGFIEANVLRFLGADGLVLAGAAIAALMAYSVWALARAIGAPRWAAASVASISLIAPLFGLAPSPINGPDDALFGCFMTLGIAAVIWAVRRDDSNCLMIAFIISIIAGLLRPGAIWPAIAIGLAALAANRKLEEGPIVGMLSSLCWAPGLYFANKIFGSSDYVDTLTPTPSALETTRDLAAANLAAADNAALSLPTILSGLLSGIPFVVFGLGAIGGLVLLFLLGKGRRRAAIAAGVATLISALGAAGYGDYDAARLLLVPIFLGLAAAIGLVLPALIARFKTRREAPSEPSAQA